MYIYCTSTLATITKALSLIVVILRPLCGVFTIMYLQQVMFLRYTSYTITVYGTYNAISRVTVTLAPSAVCAQCPVRPFSDAHRLHCFPDVLFLYICRMFARCFQSPLLLQESLLFLHSTCAVFPLYKAFLYILESSQLLS